jgi:uncharacterized protein (TIGR02611 family)
MSEQRKERQSLIERIRARRERYLQHGVIYRGAVVVAGFTVLLCGLALVVLPGPALLVIPIGLAMLSLQFAWAEKLLENALERAAAAAKTVADTSPRQKVLTAIAIVLAIGAAGTAIVLYDIPYLPV